MANFKLLKSLFKNKNRQKKKGKATLVLDENKMREFSRAFRGGKKKKEK